MKNPTAGAGGELEPVLRNEQAPRLVPVMSAEPVRGGGSRRGLAGGPLGGFPQRSRQHTFPVGPAPRVLEAALETPTLLILGGALVSLD